jgi:hypothetical protein
MCRRTMCLGAAASGDADGQPGRAVLLGVVLQSVCPFA